MPSTELALCRGRSDGSAEGIRKGGRRSTRMDRVAGAFSSSIPVCHGVLQYSSNVNNNKSTSRDHLCELLEWAKSLICDIPWSPPLSSAWVILRCIK